ncbi:hypothetical protein N0V93_009145 [Gnomoniopsis smithogilvyi]|uniref:mannan endo-1,6-alpha-mannosidase n=1 Tax=Gnomoniopsis smithogilvyi TaxID=1191159 RepID=A0A9W8YJG7_9PEZI|nr:hypothetical protein N0V93_009145 [Gnomoniopsis smithogilvyi]
MTEDMMSFYNGNEPGRTPGLLPLPYYWWEGGALMGALIDYWYYTGDTRWNSITQQGLLWQTGEDQDYMPPNQTMTEGNDDQGFWAMAVLSAAEYNFPNPSPDQPQWLALAQAVFNTQAARWDTSNCNGGLRWQIFTWNHGFDYKNSISQACFFNIAARLALYTGNETYADWAYKVWDWMIESKFMNQDSYYIYDGAHVSDNCADITPYQWTYNPGAFLLGAAAMYNYTSHSDTGNGTLWKERVDGLLGGIDVFFIGADKIMSEVACESVHLCDNDEQSFKAYLARWMAAATKWAPWIYDTVKPLLESSATAAARQCTGGGNGRMCGLMWTNNNGQWDGTTGVGQQMAAMEIVLANMINHTSSPVTNLTGGTSVGNPNAGANDIGRDVTSSWDMKPVTAVDKAGGWILTMVALAIFFGFIWFAFSNEIDQVSSSQRCRGSKNEIGPPGMVNCHLGRYGDQQAVNRAFRQENLHKQLNLDGSASTPTRSGLLEGRSMASISMYSAHQEARPTVATLLFDSHPDDQPWRRPARDGDFAGAIDPGRGNGAGFGIIDVPKARVALVPSSSTSEPEASSAAQLNELRTAAKYARKLKDTTAMRLQKQSLPQKPGLGKRQPGQTMDSDKV